MTSLIENVLGLEQEADALVEAAQAEALAIAVRAEAELQARREAVNAETAGRIKAFRVEATRSCDEELAATGRDFEAASTALRGLDAGLIARQAERVVARLKEL